MNITIQKPINVSMALERVKKEALTNGLSFSGDEKYGQGEGFGFKASYVIQTNAIVITVHKKPFIISESKITKEVDKFWTRYAYYRVNWYRILFYSGTDIWLN